MFLIQLILIDNKGVIVNNQKKRKTIGRNIDEDMIAEAIGKIQSSENLVEPSPLNPQKLNVWVDVELPSKDVLSRVRKMKYNARSFRHLNKEAVADILPTIEAAGFNSEKVRAIKVDGIYYLLGGNRRTYAVSLVKNAKLRMLVCNDLTDEEHIHYCQILDLYRGPCVLDQAYSVNEYVSNHFNEHHINPPISLLEKVFNRSSSSIHYLKSYAKITDDLISLFPSLHYIGTGFLREVVKHNDDDYLERVAENFEAIQPNEVYREFLNNIVKKYDRTIPNKVLDDYIVDIKNGASNIDAERVLFDLKVSDPDGFFPDAHDALYKASVRLQKQIIEYIGKDVKSRDETKKPIYEGFFKDIVSEEKAEKKKGIKLKTSKSGISITINENQVDVDTLKAFYDLLNRE